MARTLSMSFQLRPLLLLLLLASGTVRAQENPSPSAPATLPNAPAADGPLAAEKTLNPNAGETPSDALRATADSPSQDSLRFAFEGAPWREVIEWLAEEGDLALHIGDLPTGSLTYSDPNDFSQQEAIDRVNLFLLPQGFTLVRSGRLLSVINLSDPRSVQQLNSLAKLVQVAELEKLEGLARDLGVTLPSPFATLSFLALPVIPELRLTDLGLVDVNEFKLIRQVKRVA